MFKKSATIYSFDGNFTVYSMFESLFIFISFIMKRFNRVGRYLVLPTCVIMFIKYKKEGIQMVLKRVGYYMIVYFFVKIIKKLFTYYNKYIQKYFILKDEILQKKHEYYNDYYKDINEPLMIQLQKFDVSYSDYPLFFDVLSKSNIKKRPIFPSFTSFETFNYYFANYFGASFLYPGSTFFINALFRNFLNFGRIQYIKKGGYRVFIKCPNDAIIDTYLIDRRKKHENGKYLIIVSEGNCSFYEQGVCMNIQHNIKNFSIIGWNYPGYGQSQGLPICENIQSSIESVMEYAQNYLKFETSNIILWGWSIGGYPSSFAASLYGNINKLILDATFYDLLPLVHKINPIMKPYTESLVRYYYNLNTIELLKKYHGSILLIVRLQDDIMLLDKDEKSNISWLLAKKLLQFRFPKIFTKELLEHIQDEKISDLINLGSTNENNTLKQDLEKFEKYPCELGKEYSFEEIKVMATYLIYKYVIALCCNHNDRINYNEIPLIN